MSKSQGGINVHHTQILRDISNIIYSNEDYTRKVEEVSTLKEEFSFVISDKLKNKLLQFSVPSIEKGIYGVVTKVFPRFKNKIILDYTVTSQDIKDADSSELKVYARNKEVVLSSSVYPAFLIVIKKTFFRMFNGLNKSNLKISHDEAMELLPSSTSACYPTFSKKGSTISQFDCRKRMKTFGSLSSLNSMITFLYEHPTVIFHRVSNKLVKRKDGMYFSTPKIRQVFGIPHFICALEGVYFKEIMEGYKRSHSDRITIGYRKVEVSESVRYMRMKAKETDKEIFCGDISGCDKSVPALFTFIFALFSLNLYDSVRDANFILSLLHYFCYTPVVYSGVKKVVTNGSTTSGSALTSMFNTFVILICLETVFFVLNGRLPDKGEVLVQGDDFLILLKGKDEVVKLKNIMGQFNFRIRADADLLCSDGQDVEFLGFKWDKYCSPYQSEEWFVAKLLFPGRRVNYPGPGRLIAKYLSLLFQVRNYHSLYYKFYKHDIHLRQHIIMGKDPCLTLIDNRGRVAKTIFPVSYFLRKGWKAF
nr:TPA_asm: RNA-dependent polymerase [Aegean partiti-like virus]